jgi:hypothetical protein
VALHLARGSSAGSSLMKSGQRVQVSVERGVLMPEMASITVDFPVDCSPVTPISNNTISYSTLRLTKHNAFGQWYLHALQPKAFQAVDSRDGVFEMEFQRVNFTCHGSVGLFEWYLGRISVCCKALRVLIDVVLTVIIAQVHRLQALAQSRCGISNIRVLGALRGCESRASTSKVGALIERHLRDGPVVAWRCRLFHRSLGGLASRRANHTDRSFRGCNETLRLSPGKRGEADEVDSRRGAGAKLSH